jgi:hypothetical protein
VASVPFRITETIGLQPAPVAGGLPLPAGGAADAAEAATAATATAKTSTFSFIECFSSFQGRSGKQDDPRQLQRYEVEAVNNS